MPAARSVAGKCCFSAVEQRESLLPLIDSEPHFRVLDGDPRHEAVLSEIGLSP